ncbi:MAG: DUF2892 domain-containing protein, partial [Verrucomicrobia bacterium]|nr:DUF2892 domain-containing protein [Verrucomicrobiota bacterium]
MKKNIGKKDRLIRAILSFLLFIAAWYTGSFIVLLIALFVLYEVLSSWCLVYYLIG